MKLRETSAIEKMKGQAIAVGVLQSFIILFVSRIHKKRKLNHNDFLRFGYTGCFRFDKKVQKSDISQKDEKKLS